MRRAGRDKLNRLQGDIMNAVNGLVKSWSIGDVDMDIPHRSISVLTELHPSLLNDDLGEEIASDLKSPLFIHTQDHHIHWLQPPTLKSTGFLWWKRYQLTMRFYLKELASLNSTIH